ncbi:MAG: nitrite/sulfite reductase [Betaproteobacteria bacterium]
MYQYTDFDTEFIANRAAQYRDQLQRHLDGRLSDDDFRPLRLQNGWYIQRHAPMLRVAVPYGELSSTQARVLAQIARDYDRGYAHLTTRQNIQFNWIPLERSADVMDLLASVKMHGIQTSGNCIRNITSDELAGIAVDEVADPRPFCEILRQWSTLHPEFAFLPRKFKIAVTGALEDRTASAWHDVGLHLLRNAEGELGFRVLVGGGMGRTPVIASTLRSFVPWHQVLNYLEAVVRVYNRWGRRDNAYKARIKILVKAEGTRFTHEVEDEYQQILELDGAAHTITDAELARVSASFVAPTQASAASSTATKVADMLRAAAQDDLGFARWLAQNVAPHRDPNLRAVTLSFKRLGHAPGDATATQLLAAADLADAFSAGELRVTHDQNLLLPWVRCDQLAHLWQAARKAGFGAANIRLLTDMITCPGGDFCGLANARSLPIAQAIQERYQDMDELHDLGEIDLHISGCMNSCGHHHSGQIGILGVDKDCQEWYQLSLGGSDGSRLSGAATPGKVVGPSFGAEEIPDIVAAVLDVYRLQRLGCAVPAQRAETFIDTLRRVGVEPFKLAANAARHETAASLAI